jgi:long-chain acyl-CoA synthetase
MTPDDVFLSFLPLAHILDRMIEEYFFHKGGSVGYYHGVRKSTTAFSAIVFFYDSTLKCFLFHQDLNALRDDLMELKPTLLVGVPRVYERIHEGGEIRYLYRLSSYIHQLRQPLCIALGILKAIAELRPLRRVIFNALYNR